MITLFDVHSRRFSLGSNRRILYEKARPAGLGTSRGERERVAALPAGLPGAASSRSEEARPAGLEPATPGLEGRCSIQLSYGRTWNAPMIVPLRLIARNAHGYSDCCRSCGEHSMTQEQQMPREQETQQGGKPESEPINQPDRSINPNRQIEHQGDSDDTHFGDGVGQSDRPNQGDLRQNR